MLKLSMFKAVRKFNIFNNKMEQVEDLLQGETVEFYPLGLDEIEAIQKSINKEDKYSDENYLIELIKNVTNIEVDITAEELKQIKKRPSKIFVELHTELLAHMAYLVENAKEIVALESKVNDTLEKMGITKDMIEKVEKLDQVKSKKEQLEEINNELESCEDLKRYKELQALKLELEKEVELNE